MKIELFKIDKFKNLENIEQLVEGKHIMLVGENGVGKSSVIQFLEIAFGNTKNIPPNAVGSGEVVTSIDGRKYTFQVTFIDGKPKVTIISPDGLKDTRRGALAEVVGAMDFDIDSFVEKSKSVAGRKEQIEIFKSFLPQETKEQLQAFENHVTTAYNERTEIGRDIKKLEGAVKANPLSGQTLSKFKSIDVASTMASLKEAQEFNSKVDKVISNAAARSKEISNINEEIEKMKLALKEKISLQDQASEWIKNNPIKDTSSFEESINNATKANLDYTNAKTLIKQLEELNALREDQGELTAKIDSEKQAIADAIKDMDSPVEGLMYDESQLVYNGIPVNPDSLSTSEIMELGVRLKMAENPKLGILFLQRTESLGTKRLQEIINMCNKAGWELVMEEVRRNQNELKIELFTETL